ncbi:MAG: NnrS family protein [Mariprofundaceae bacterium]|nr:NnrS family protein [Mariprofundaceae bacterium]
MKIEIEQAHEQTLEKDDWVLFRLGFRPFFIAAACWSVVAMGLWMAEIVFSIDIVPEPLSPSFWHAHEMIYGYALAVIAGFLLTAVRNWTGIQTLHGSSLQGLLLLWLVARIAPLFPNHAMLVLGLICDGLFIVALSVALTWPIVQAKLWKNMVVVSKLYFFLPGHVLYSLGVLGMFPDGERLGVYIGLYMVLSLILVLSRRLIPMFIERGIDTDGVKLRNCRWVDLACFLLFLVFITLDVFFALPVWIGCLALVLAALHAIRLWGWYHPDIWNHPLLWVLYVGYGWVVIAFVLKAASIWLAISPTLAVHAFAVGAIGMMTIGMIARIALGHTGRNIKQPPRGVAMVFGALLAGAIVRVFAPLVVADHDLVVWIALSQGLWMMAYVLLLWLYMSILINPRIDGKWG